MLSHGDSNVGRWLDTNFMLSFIVYLMFNCSNQLQRSPCPSGYEETRYFEESSADPIRLPSDTSNVAWQKSQVLLHHCDALSIAEKRQVFSAMRATGVDVSKETHHLYMPHIGVTFGEFSVLYVVSDYVRRNGK